VSGTHPVTFTGRVLFEPARPDTAGAKRFVLVDRRGAAALMAVDDPFAGEVRVTINERPVRASVDHLVKDLSDRRDIGEVVAVGDGALLDAAKLVGQ
jgi:glycerol dehydrogenase-like iron-containing ADH family enzyme